ncbi:unnamed protein product [Ectocarpus sp. CCAP 1310/34]|nr:unnamed protein product [Ectocarpus sp. CCAP 1310/34]
MGKSTCNVGGQSPVPPSHQEFQFQQNATTTAPVPPDYDQMATPAYDQVVKGRAPSALAPMDRC